MVALHPVRLKLELQHDIGLGDDEPGDFVGVVRERALVLDLVRVEKRVHVAEAAPAATPLGAGPPSSSSSETTSSF